MEAFVGMIALFPYDFVPEGWIACDGSLVSVNTYQALYSLLGNRFGGEAPRTFGVPNLLPVQPAGCRYAIAANGIYPPRP